jgi:hypothetical protein
MSVSLSALQAGRPPFTPRNIRGIHFCYRLNRSQGHSTDRTTRSIEKSNNLIGNRTRYLSACSIVPQPTTLPRALRSSKHSFRFLEIISGPANIANLNPTLGIESAHTPSIAEPSKGTPYFQTQMWDRYFSFPWPQIP